MTFLHMAAISLCESGQGPDTQLRFSIVLSIPYCLTDLNTKDRLLTL